MAREACVFSPRAALRLALPMREAATGDFGSVAVAEDSQALGASPAPETRSRAQAINPARSRPYVGAAACSYASKRPAARSTSREAPTALPRARWVKPTHSWAS